MLFLSLSVDEDDMNEYYEKELRYSQMTRFMRSINTTGALVRPNYITRNS